MANVRYKSLSREHVWYVVGVFDEWRHVGVPLSNCVREFSDLGDSGTQHTPDHQTQADHLLDWLQSTVVWGVAAGPEAVGLLLHTVWPRRDHAEQVATALAATRVRKVKGEPVPTYVTWSDDTLHVSTVDAKKHDKRWHCLPSEWAGLGQQVLEMLRLVASVDEYNYLCKISVRLAVHAGLAADGRYGNFEPFAGQPQDMHGDLASAFMAPDLLCKSAELQARVRAYAHRIQQVTGAPVAEKEVA